MLERAARVGDPVEHTHRFAGGAWGLLAGVAIGVAIVLTAPVSIPAGIVAGGLVVAGMAGTVLTSALVAESVGETVGAHVSAPNAGDILDGAHTVYTGPRQPRAARMSDPLKCHEGQTIAEGSDSVFIENWNASRKGDATQCGGKIQDGCANVLIGGNSIGRHGSADRSELPGWFQNTKWGLDWASTILGFVNGKGELKVGVDLLLQASGAVVKGYSQTNLPGAKAVGAYGGAIVGAGKLRQMGSPSTWGAGAKLAGKTAQAGQSVVGQGNSLANFFGSGPAPTTY